MKRRAMGVSTGPGGGYTQKPTYGGGKKKVAKPTPAQSSSGPFGTSKPVPKPPRKK